MEVHIDCARYTGVASQEGGLLSAGLSKHKALHPASDSQWVEDRFWAWDLYGTTTVGRGELLAEIDFLDNCTC